MQKIAQFEKVSFEQFKKDVEKVFRDKYTEAEIFGFWETVELPTRATKGSAGYDFKIPFDLKMFKYTPYLIPTGIRCKMFDEWVLKIYPRSGLGTKHGFKLENTTGIIDSDYYYSDNEGHIMLKVSQDKKDILEIKSGQGIAQGIFSEYGITFDDNVIANRNGGFGSTGK